MGEVPPLGLRGCRTCDDDPCNRTNKWSDSIMYCDMSGEAFGMQKPIYRRCQTVPPGQEGSTKVMGTVTARVLLHKRCVCSILGLASVVV